MIPQRHPTGTSLCPANDGPSDHLWVGPNGRVHQGRPIKTHAGRTVIDCQLCGFAHVTPLPDPLPEKERAPLKPWDEPQRLWQKALQKDRLAQCETILGKGRRLLLDLNPDDFTLLEAAREMDWMGCGLEPCPDRTHHATDYGLRVINEAFAANSVYDLTDVDLVVMSGLLDTAPDPMELVDWASQLVRPGGLLLVTADNPFNGFRQTQDRLAGGENQGALAAPPDALNFFTFETLETLVAGFGLEPVARTTRFPVEMLRLQTSQTGEDATCNDAEMAQNFDQAFDDAGTAHIRRQFYTTLAQINLGSELVVIAQKP